MTTSDEKQRGRTPQSADLSEFDLPTIEQAQKAVTEFMDWIADTGGDNTGKLSLFAQDALVHQFAWHLSRRSQQEADGWRPVETCPRDGTQVILWSAMWEMSWGIQIGHFEGDGEGGGEWVTGEGSVDDNEPDFDPDAKVDEEGEDFDIDANMGPTHWQPLPAAPQSTGGK